MNHEELREEIAIEFEALDVVVDELSQLLHEFRDVEEPPIREKTAASAFLAQFYNGIENILKRFYKFSGTTLPEGFDWHIALFKAFCNPPRENLPLLFSDELASKLAPFRRFRHVVHHGYGFQIEWSRIKPGLDAIGTVYPQFHQVVNKSLEESRTNN